MRGALAGAVVAWGMMAAAIPVQAGDLTTCMTAAEADAFQLRHLQSRLMVAGLACNQRDAYNNFVQEFRPPLAGAGASLIHYFQRTGGGQTALNRHITDLANAAGLYRAEDPEEFCEDTWNMFLLLEEDPYNLPAVAASHLMDEVGLPRLCAEPLPSVHAVPPVIQAVGPDVVKTSSDGIGPAITK